MEAIGTSCKITPINVGSGDSILVQLRGVRGDEHYYLIDGGPKEYFSNVESCLKYHDLIKRPRFWEVKPVLHCSVIVTHPDQDHVNGITELMEKYLISGWIIITEAFERKLKMSSERTSMFLRKFFIKLTSTHSPTGQFFSPTGIIWWQSPTDKCLCYVPRVDAPSMPQPSMSEPGPLHITGLDRWNKSSILTTVPNPCIVRYAAVLTGDSFGDIVLRTLNLDGEHTRIFQVPHHGSKRNIKVGKEGTLDMCTELYSSFTADVYVISGSDKIHPHAEVLSGILKAVYEKNGSGKIVLTGSRGLSAEKIIKSRHMPTGRDYQTFLQRRMQIVHIDDIGIFCEHKQVSQPFITITVAQGSEDCKVLGGVPWTPETYYMEKCEIICQCREYCADVFGWTTSFECGINDIDLFDRMHLLKVPFHEEPWKDARNDRDQQYVYIVRASLEFANINYRQVLYLKEIKSAHNKLYEMFAYSDLCWTRKYVPRIFQLRFTGYHPIGPEYRINIQRLRVYIDQLYPIK